MNSLSTDERKLLVIQFFNFLSYSLVGVFVTVFFYSNSDLKTTILYNSINMASFTLVYALSGWIFKKLSTGTWMKLSFLVAALFYFILFFLREQSVAYILPLGIIGGFSGGAFWSAYNLNQYILTHSGRRVEYFGWGGALMNLANAIGPVMGGWIISVVAAMTMSLTTGYVTLFLLVFLIMVFAVIVIGKLPTHETPQFFYNHFWQHQRSRRWKFVLAWQSVFGLYDVASVTVTGVLLYLVIKDEAALGFILTLASVMGLIGSIMSIRILKRFPKSFWIGAVGSAVALAWFALDLSIVGVWFLIIVGYLTAPFMFTAMSAEYFNTIDEAHGTWHHKYHMMLEQPMLFCTMRTISYVLLYIFLQFGDEISIARVWLLFLPIFPLTIGLLFHLGMKNKGHTTTSPVVNPVP